MKFMYVSMYVSKVEMEANRTIKGLNVYSLGQTGLIDALILMSSFAIIMKGMCFDSTSALRSNNFLTCTFSFLM